MGKRLIATRRAFLGGAGVVGAAALLTRSHEAKAHPPTSVNVKDFGAVGDGSTNDHTSIQNAINAAYGGTLYFPPGNYVINQELNITARVHVVGVPGTSNILHGTVNQNGIVVGDGTTTARGACANTTIESIGFYPKVGLGSSTSGHCILLNYTDSVSILGCIFDGRDSGGPRRLFNGICADTTTEYFITNCKFIGLLGNGHLTRSASPSEPCADGRIDFCEFISIQSDCIYFGTTTGGMTVNSMIAFGYDAWAVNIDVAPGASNNVNYFIQQPDLEVASAASGGIYCKRGSNIQIVGGWIGIKDGTQRIGLKVDSTTGAVLASGVFFNLVNIVLSGNSCTLADCDVVGDNSTMPTGVTINSTASDAVITGCRIRQWVSEGVKLVDSPPRCIVNGTSFRNNALNVTGDAFASSGAPPYIRGCYDDGSNFTLTATAVLPLRHGMDFIAVTGATVISSMIATGFGSRLTIFSLGGINISNSASITLKGAVNATVPSGATIDFICDGANWRETSRSY